MMSLVELGWRQFTFFEKRNIYDPTNTDVKFHGLKNLKSCCCVSGDGFTLFGEAGGAIFKLSRKMEEYCWIAHQRSLANIALAGNIVATVGEDEEGVNSLVKIWQLDRIEKEAPFCLRVIRVCPLLGIARAIRACSVSLHSSLQHIAVGFVDSSVIYATGNITKEKISKWLVVKNGSNVADEMICVCLAWFPAQKTCVIYSLSSSSVHSYAITNRVVVNTVVHDAKGCSRDCWSFNESRNQLIVGSNEMVYFYDAELTLVADPDSGKGRCHALGRTNNKIQLLAFDNYVALLTALPSAIPSSKNSRTLVVSIYDVEVQCVAFSCAMPNLSCIFLLDSVLMLLSMDGTLAALTEKHISAKLEILLKKNLYDLAVGVARRNPAASDYLPEIYKQYGDYLYRSGDFDNAVKQYMETVGFLEPSYVIKKFLDGSRIKELCSYLGILHKRRKATPQHTSILLNSYIRLGAREKIEEFIEHISDCNIETAVQVLRTAQYTAEACRLCAKNKLHETLLSIMIEDCGNYHSAIEYIGKSDSNEAESHIAKFGKCLLENCPHATVELLAKRACFDQIDAARLTNVFVGHPVRCIQFIETALKDNAENQQLRNILLELELRQWSEHSKNSSEDADEILSLIGEKNFDESLRLCQMFDFIPGIVYIYMKQQKHDELIGYLMRQNDLQKIVQLCQQKNSRDLWINTVLHATREQNLDVTVIPSLLDRLEIGGSIPPLVVLDILSRSECVLIGHVRDYIVKWLKEQCEQIANDQKAVEEKEAKMTIIEEQLENIHFRPQVFQMNKCSACETSLQLPVVHFLCKHSYHAHCLESYSEKADSCPACSRNDSERAIYEGGDDFKSKGAYKSFQNEVNSKTDCMSVISTYVSSGLFNVCSPSRLQRLDTNSPTVEEQHSPYDEVTLDNSYSFSSSIHKSKQLDKSSKYSTEDGDRVTSANAEFPTNPFEDNF